MKKPIVSLLLAIVLILAAATLPAGAATEGTKVSTVAEFEAMVSGEKYYLANDIDFGGKEYDCFIFEEFSGTIDGNGHSIYNYKLSNNGKKSNVGTIHTATTVGDLIIKDLSFGKEGSPIVMRVDADCVGAHHGIIAGQQDNKGFSATFTNVKVYADIEVAEKCNTGGYIGYSRMFSFTDCETYGKISVGTPGAVIANYVNAAGFIGSANLAMQTLTNCKNYAEIVTHCSTYYAAAAGIVCYSGKITNLVNCANYGNVSAYDTPEQKSDSYAAGMIARANLESVELTGCTNYGKITGTNRVSGFIAHVTAGAFIDGCVNEGEYSKDAEHFGPFVGLVDPASYADIDALCVDKTDPNYVPPETTPDETTPEETTPDAATPDATTPDETTPDETTPDETTPDETTPDDKKKGCGSLIAISPMLVIFGAAAAGLLRKKRR